MAPEHYPIATSPKSLDAGLLNAARAHLAEWFRENWKTLIVATVISLAIYVPFATSVIFTNHTIPNAFYWTYPSFRSQNEGRWFADLILLIVGGNGNQFLQTIIGSIVQSINGLLFCDLFGVRGTAKRLLLTLIVCLHPVVLDYMSWTADYVGFALGDACVLIGFLVIAQVKQLAYRVILASLSFLFALAVYPPKISLIVVIALCFLAYNTATQEKERDVLTKYLTTFVGSFIISVCLYWLTLLVSIKFDNGARTNINSIAEILHGVVNAYVASGDSIVKQFNTLPWVGAIAAWALLAIGLASLLGQAALKGGFRLGAVVLLLFLLPIALRASYIINNATGEDAGRIATGYLYLVAFVVAVSLNAPRVASLSLIASTALAYSYAVVDSRETSFLALKTIFETNELNRIVGRIEALLPDFTQRSLIVIGEPAFGLASDYMPDVNRALRPGIIANTFASFRQPQIVDFFLAGVSLALRHRPKWMKL